VGGDLISLDEAFRLLRSSLPPRAAAQRLDDAIRRERTCRLLCDGNEVDTQFAEDYLRVRAVEVYGPWRTTIEGEGAWRVVIETTWNLEKPADAYCWQFYADEVRALQAAAKPRSPPGRKPRGNWPQLLIGELTRRQEAGERLDDTANVDALTRDIRDLLKKRLDDWAPEPKHVRARVLDFIRSRRI
jgi:hypothetical protein